MDMPVFNTIRRPSLRRDFFVYLCTFVFLFNAAVVAEAADGVLVDGVGRAGARQSPACPISAETGKVCPLPDDNLIQNPWFRTGNRPSLDGWIVIGPADGGWRPSQKLGNPTPDDVVGTAARLSVDRSGRRQNRPND